VGFPDFESPQVDGRSCPILAHFQPAAVWRCVRYVAADCTPLRAVGEHQGRQGRLSVPL